MTESLLYLAAWAIVGLLVWNLELRSRCRTYSNHIKYLEDIWYEKTFGDGPKSPPPTY